MVFRDIDKKALIDNAATVLSKITVIGTDIVFTENDHISEWEYEDFRYVPENGFIGQFVERLFDGRLENLPSDIDIENKEINLQLGIVNGITGETTYYDYGNFIITKIGEEDTTGVTTFESADYAKKFNKPYVDTIAYPCTTLELANNVCNQAGVELATDGYAYVYVTPKEGLEAGQYCFAKDDVYYNFAVDEDLYFYDSFMFIENKSELILKVINVDFTLTRKNIQYTESNNAVGTVLNFNKVGYCDFINNDFGIENNQFAEGGTLRDVIKAIGALAYSWVRIGTDNRVYLDFTKKDESDVNLYNVITTDDYYENDAQLETYGPVNKVVLGMSNVEGEYVSKEIALEGVNKETSIQIWDNPFTYTEELRKVALNGSETLFGLTYTPMSIDTVGHPWLEGDDYVKITNLSNQSLYTYPFDRALSYRGYIKSVLSSNAKNTIQNEYEFEGDIVQAQKRTQLIVDKANQTIQLISEKVEKIEGEDYVTSAELKVATDSIQSNISATYSTKTETIEVVNQAKEDAVTEATENATAAVDEKIQDLPTQEDVETAKNEAISSANTATDTKLEDYSTTTETSAIIDDAKQDAIDAATQNATSAIDGKLEDYSTTEETNAAINSAKEDAVTSANNATDEKLKKYSTTIEMNNAITQTVNASENSIMLEVNKKVDDEELTSAKIIARINDDTSEAVIKADKISLEGQVIKMTSDDISIESDNLTIDKDGKMELVSNGIEEYATFVVKNSDDTLRTTMGAGAIDLGTSDQYYHKTIMVTPTGRTTDTTVTSNHQETVMYDNYDSGVFYKMDTSYNDDGCHISTGGMPIFLNGIDIFEKNMITVGLSKNFDPAVTSWTNYTVPFDVQKKKLGNRLIFENNGITIGQGVSEVLVSGNAQVRGTTSDIFVQIRKNSTIISQGYYRSTVATNYGVVGLTPQLIQVKAGDRITMEIGAGANATLTMVGTSYGWLTVEAKTTEPLTPSDNNVNIDQNIYSYEERVVGKWINNKPLYRKTFKINMATVGNGNVAHNIENVEDIWVNQEASYLKNGIYTLPIAQYGGASGNDWFRFFTTPDTIEYRFGPTYTSTTNLIVAITLCYTKTTDSSI